MTQDQEKIIDEVLKVFQLEELEDIWDSFDEGMWALGWLSDDQIYREVDTLLYSHIEGNARCADVNCEAPCFVSQILDAISTLLMENQSTQVFNPNTRYMFEFYLCLSQSDQIVVDK